ncbi:MAG: hypothetical protein HQK96_04855 [Nitrospirae bacterium]|nr:hypothetical protein [Nitrospirota bacterium]
MDTRSMDGNEGAGGQGRLGEKRGEKRFETPVGQHGDNGYGHYGRTFRDASAAFDVLQRLSGRGVAEDAIDHSLNWLILSAWNNLDRMKEIQDDIVNRLQEIKKATGILN